MPRSDVVFRVASEDDETEDEIEIIPYVKPAPVVIDLLESDSDDGSGQESKKKSPKKKNKKKKSKKRDSERSTENSTLCSTSRNETSETSVSTINVDTISQAIECLPDNSANSGVEEVVSVQVVEPTTSVEVENGSRNVDTPCNSSSTGVSSETSTSSLCQVGLSDAGPSSLFEKCHDARSTTELVTGKTTGIGMVGVGATATPSAQKDNDKSKKSKEKKAKGEGRSRVRTMSATQRTNEEIVSFLTTLGIQMETTAFDTPPTRRRQQRKRQSAPAPLPPPTDEIEENSRDSLVTNSSDGSSFPRPVLVKDTGDKAASSVASYVSVTQESNSPSKLEQGTPKGRRQRQAVAGDISDYTVSFKDLKATTTNIQSNILVPPIDSSKKVDQSFITVQSSDKGNQNSSTTKVLKPCYYAQVIDAVSKGLDSSLLSSNSGSEATSVVASSSAGKADDGKTVEGTTGKKLDQVEVVASKNIKEIGDQHRFKELENVEKEKQINVVGSTHIPHPSTSVTTEDSPKVHTNEKRSPIKVAEENTQQKSDVECITILEPEINVPIIFKPLGNITGGSTTSTTEPNIESTATAKDNAAVSMSTEKLSSARKEDNNNKRKRVFIPNIPAKRSELTDKPRGRGREDVSSLSHDRKRRRHDSSDKIYSTSTKTGDKTLSSDCQILRQSAKENSPESWFPETWTDHMKDFYGSNQNEDFELDDVMRSLPDSRNLWSAYKDWMLPPTTKRRHVRCDRCKQLGHLIKECKEKYKPPTCHYCGKVGHSAEGHSRNNRPCPDALCLNCGRRSSRYAQKCHKCLLQNRPGRCEVCNVLGHDKSICPDNWRRYHSMISPEDYRKAEELLRSKHYEGTRRSSSQALDKHVYKRTSAMFCSNCGRNGHIYYDCGASKFNTYPRNKPFVIRDVKIREPAQPTKESENASSGRSKGVTSIPISYDSRTGRTVVLNAEADDQPELAVETIQIKITNDLALKAPAPVDPVRNAESGYRSTTDNHSIAGGVLPKVHETAKLNAELGFQYLACDHESCSNRLPSDEKCYQSMISAHSHLRLLEAQHQGILKPLEEKYNVQICVINSHSLMVHITGSHVLEAETDLYRLLEGTLWRKQLPSKNFARARNTVPKINATEEKESTMVQKTQIGNHAVTENAMTDSDPIVIVVDEDDDITCVKVSVRESSKNGSPPKSKSASNPINNSPERNPTFFLDESPSAVEVIDPIRIENEKEEEKTAEESTRHRNEDTVSPSWKNYESPLTGLCLAIDPPKNAEAAKSQANLSSKEKDESKKPANEASVTADVPEENVEVQEVKRCYDIIQVIETLDASSDFSESDGIDHTEEKSSTQSREEKSQDVRSCDQDRYSPDLDLIVVDPPPKTESYEVITIDDDDEPVSKRQKISDENEESVTLLPSEWNLVMTESVKKGSVLERISNSYDAVVEISKESSSIIIRDGTKKSRRQAKEAIVYWLESQCLNTGTRKEHEHAVVNGTPTPGPSNIRKRVLNLNDAHQCNPPGDQAAQRKARWKRSQRGKRGAKKKRKQNKMNSSTNLGPDVSPSDTSSCSSGTNTPTKKNKLKKGNASSSLYNSRSPLHSPSPKKMRRRQKTPNNNNNPDFSTPSAPATPKPGNKRVRYFQNQNV